MKRILMVLMVLSLAAFVPAMAQTFVPPDGALYGVTADGVYYVAKSLVDAANGNAPKLLAAPGFKPEEMKLDGSYYVFASGRKLRVGVKTDFCFDIGNNRFIPHALVGDERIKPADAADNGVGGYNFRLMPIPPK